MTIVQQVENEVDLICRSKFPEGELLHRRNVDFLNFQVIINFSQVLHTI